MNVLQLMKQARYDVDAIRTGSVASAMWQDEEVLQATNIAMDTAARILRLSGSDLLTRTMKSTDSGIQLIREVYSPTVSLRITAGVDTYTLPENCVRVVSIRPITTGYGDVRFHPTSHQHTDYQDLRSSPVYGVTVANEETDFYYVVTGARTLTVAPVPTNTFDIELVYHVRPARMRYVQNGTVQRVSGQVTVTGSGTTWLSSGIRLPAELLVGLTNINTVQLDASYPSVGTAIGTDTTLLMSLPSVVTDGVGQTYTLAMAPTLPEEHHTWLAQLTAAILMRKVDMDLSTKLQADLGMTFLSAITPEVTLRQLQESLITEAFAISS